AHTTTNTTLYSIPQLSGQQSPGVQSSGVQSGLTQSSGVQSGGSQSGGGTVVQGGSPGGGQGVTVSSTSALIAALKAAHPGDTIKLAAGTYSSVVIQKLSFSSPVTITSADSNHPAVLTGLNVVGSNGLKFTGLVFSPPSGTHNPFQVNNSQNISFDK